MNARARRSADPRKRGVALIMVLGALTILTVMLTEFQTEASQELASAVTARDALKAEYAARSAVSLTRLLIAAEPTIRKKIGFLVNNAQIKVWEYAEPVLGAFNDAQGKEAFSNLAAVDLTEGRNLGLEGASFSVQVVDENAKLNINQPAAGSLVAIQRLGQQIITQIGRPQYQELFDGFDADGELSDAKTVCAAIVDWTDPDQDAADASCEPGSETAQQAAAEDSFYQQLDPPYLRKNAAFDSLEELRMVRGISDAFWHTFVDPDPDNPDKRNWTVWGDTKINVNSATPQNILMLACSNFGQPDHPTCNDPEKAVSFLTAVGMVRNLMPGVPAFASPKAFLGALKGKGPFGLMAEITGLEPFTKFNAPPELQRSVTTESEVFSIYATGRTQSGTRGTQVRVHAVVDFRGAPKPGAPTLGRAEVLAGALEAAGEKKLAKQLQQMVDNVKLPEDATEDAITSAFVPNPGGNIVYFRVE